MCTKISDLKKIEYSANGKLLSFDEPLVMAIVNVTPDSFYDGGKYGHTDDIVSDVAEKISAGAHIIDLGAASSRPGAAEIGEDEEWQRLEPVLVTLRKKFPSVFISVDTYRSGLARKAAAAGADMINDIGGGELDPGMFDAIQDINLPYVLMHIKGRPLTMQNNPSYGQVVEEVRDHLLKKSRQLQDRGFQKIILDPGFGFGKSLEHNYKLLGHLQAFSKLGFPVLAGLSRKGMISKVLDTNPVTALNGTTVLNTIALLNGALILRVHDVREARQAIQLVKTYRSVL